MFHPVKATLIALLAIVLFPAGRAGAGGVIVATDIPPVAAILRAIVGARADVRELIPPRMTSHDFTLKPSDIATIQAADLVVWMGPQATPGLAGLLAQDWAAQKALGLNGLAGTRHLPLRKTGLFDGAAGSTKVTDPHSWLDPENAIYWARTIAARLGQIDPGNAIAFNAGRDRLIKRINSVRAEIKAQLGQAHAKPFVQYHDGFHYFERTFGLMALGAASNVSEETPSLGTIARLQGALARSGPSCVFLPADIPPQRANSLTALKDVSVQVLDALGRNIPADSYNYPALLRALGKGYADCFSTN